MKNLLFLILFLSSFQIQAMACKCNCRPADIGLCASGYDLDHPCGSVCPVAGGAVPVSPLITACPLVQVDNPILGIKVLVSSCND